MKLTLKPTETNAWPLVGALLRGDTPKQWLEALHAHQISLSTVEVFPLPDRTVNSVWGCLVLPLSSSSPLPAHPFPTVQQVSRTLYITAYSTLFPPTSSQERADLFAAPTLLHPSLGAITLGQPLDWATVLVAPQQRENPWQKPAKTVAIPQCLRSIRLEEADPEEALQRLTETEFPQQEPKTEAPLSDLEKLKLKVYQSLFSKKGKSAKLKTPKAPPPAASKPPSGLARWLAKWRGQIQERMLQDLDELERRNKKEADKLMDMFKQDFREALKWAIPLNSGTERGSQQQAQWKMQRNTGQASARRGTGGTISLPDEQVHSLRQQYYDAAQQLEREKDHTQASFVYLKLLKDYQAAARTLRTGKKYAEAGALYEKYCQDKRMAAQCYEEGHLTLEAIKCYQELNEHEKAGDLYMNLGEKEQAHAQYEYVLSNYQKHHQHYKAGELVRNKLDDLPRALAVYRAGWEAHTLPCLQAYVEHQPTAEATRRELQNLDQQAISPQQTKQWIGVLMEEYRRKRGAEDIAQSLAYTRIAEAAPSSPDVTRYLREFHPGDSNLIKDTIRYTNNKSRKK